MKINTPVAQFKVLNFQELRKLQHVSSDTIQLAKLRDESNYLAEINKLVEIPKAQQIEKTAPEYDKNLVSKTRKLSRHISHKD